MRKLRISPEDRVRLRHMLDAALEIRQYVQSAAREDLSDDRKLLHSLVHLIEIIGEAATQVSAQLQADAPEIPWSVIKGMRNRLIHAYFDIDADILWSTSTMDIPFLVTELTKLIDE